MKAGGMNLRKFKSNSKQLIERLNSEGITDNVESLNCVKLLQLRFNRLVFGLTPSPAILGGVVQHHLEKYKQSEPEVIDQLQKLQKNETLEDDTSYVKTMVGPQQIRENSPQQRFLECAGTLILINSILIFQNLFIMQVVHL